jgi:pantetheine-phosphate adenylyltransferase
MFTQEERMRMMQEYVDHFQLTNVTVDAYIGATIRYVQSKGSRVIVKGLRSTDDFHPEQQQALGNAMLAPDVETFCLFGRPERFQISSSLVRELALLGESIEAYVLPSVARMVEDAVQRFQAQQ